MAKQGTSKQEISSFLSKEQELEALLEAMKSLESITELKLDAKNTYVESGYRVNEAAAALMSAAESFKKSNISVEKLMSELNNSNFTALKTALEELGPALKKQQKSTDALIQRSSSDIKEQLNLSEQSTSKLVSATDKTLQQSSLDIRELINLSQQRTNKLVITAVVLAALSLVVAVAGLFF